MVENRDVLSGGQEKPPRVRRFRRVRMPRVPRWALLGVGLLVAAGMVVLLRAAAGPVVPAVPDPTPAAESSVVALPTGPFDRLAGRTPIPVPTRSGDLLGGALPATGGPDKAAALAAAQLVLGRYCARPDRYTLTVAPQAGWFVVGVAVIGLDRGGDGPLIDLSLTWTGGSYAWSGRRAQLRVC